MMMQASLDQTVVGRLLRLAIGVEIEGHPISFNFFFAQVWLEQDLNSIDD
jgi:hypothetical protein